MYWLEIGQVVDFDVTEDNGILKASWRPPTNLESCDIIYKLQCNENDEKTNDTEITFGKVVACKIYELSIRPFIAEKEGSASTKTYTGKVSGNKWVHQIKRGWQKFILSKPYLTRISYLKSKSKVISKSAM